VWVFFFFPATLLSWASKEYVHGKVRAELAVHLPDDSSQVSPQTEWDERDRYPHPIRAFPGQRENDFGMDLRAQSTVRKGLAYEQCVVEGYRSFALTLDANSPIGPHCHCRPIFEPTGPHSKSQTAEYSGLNYQGWE